MLTRYPYPTDLTSCGLASPYYRSVPLPRLHACLSPAAVALAAVLSAPACAFAGKHLPRSRRVEPPACSPNVCLARALFKVFVSLVVLHLIRYEQICEAGQPPGNTTATTTRNHQRSVPSSHLLLWLSLVRS